MQYRIIGKTGVKISEIGFGCGNNAVLMVKASHQDQVKAVRRALELVLLNPRLDARRALEIGLVTTVAPVDEHDTVVRDLAQKLAQGATGAYGVAKMLMNQASGTDRLDFHLDQELQHLVRSADGPEFAEGIAAFFGKRDPRFQDPG
jgi:enoyl-CoA hydratase/carnithine racemase